MTGKILEAGDRINFYPNETITEMLNEMREDESTTQVLIRKCIAHAYLELQPEGQFVKDAQNIIKGE